MSGNDWGFGDPSGPGDQFKNAEHVGRLVAFVDGKRENKDTRFGVQEATVCRYAIVLDGDEAGTVYDDCVIFGNLGKDAHNVESNIVIGRIVRGEAKPGREAPYWMDPATDEDKQVAGEWFDKNARINSVGAVLIT